MADNRAEQAKDLSIKVLEVLQPAIAEAIASVMAAPNAPSATVEVADEPSTPTPSTDVDGVKFLHASSETRRAKVVQAARVIISSGDDLTWDNMAAALAIKPGQMRSYCSNPKRTTGGGALRPSLEVIYLWATAQRDYAQSGRSAMWAGDAADEPSAPIKVQKKAKVVKAPVRYATGASPSMMEKQKLAIAHLKHARELAIQSGLIRKDKTMSKRLAAYATAWNRKFQA